MKHMNAVVYKGPNNIEIQTIPVPRVKKGWALIKVAFCGICGTDLNIYSGNHPRAQKGAVIGHEISGKVIEHSTLEEGTPVTIRPLLFCEECESCKNGYPHVCESLRLLGIDQPGGMAEYVLVPEEEVYSLPEGMSLKRGALIEPFAVAVHAIRESNFKAGDDVVVFGAGPIGICTAIALKLFGAQKITIIEVQPYRKSLAKSIGFNVIDGTEESELIQQAEVVFDCAAHPLVAKELVNVTKIKGQIMLVGTYERPVKIDLQNITFKELSLKGARVYTEKDFRIATKLLSKDFNFEKIISHVYSIESVKTPFKDLSTGKDGLKILISF